MFVKLALLFIILPILELALLIEVGQRFGFWPTFALVVATGLLGAALARSQGRRAWRAIQQRLARGELPDAELLDGVLVLLAGIVLVTPGLITDLLGLTLLIPPARRWVRQALRRRLAAQVTHTGAASGPFFFHRVEHQPSPWRSTPTAPHGAYREGDVIDISPEEAPPDDQP